MKTHELHWQTGPAYRRASRPLDLFSAGHASWIYLLTLLPVVLLPIFTTWAISAGLLEYAAATFWASGFTFLALAVDTNGQRLVWLLVSGLATLALAWASSRVAPGFATLAALLIGAWLAAPAMRRLMAQTVQPESDRG